MNETPDDTAARKVGLGYAWLVFALTVGLLLSDYMSRQVLVSVFPQLRAEWRLNDVQLGSLVSIVALMVGLLTLPLSILADRIGRVRSIVLMAILWSLATVACGLAANYQQMFIARLCIGVGEAAYGSVGAAVLLSIFPASLRATITGAFMAGGALGSVAGLAVGGIVADYFDWRSSFFTIAALGMALALLYGLLVTDRRVAAAKPTGAGLSLGGVRRLLGDLFGKPGLLAVYAASGAQILVTAAMLAWLPSFLNRAYHLSTAASASLGAGFLLVLAVGSTFCGFVVDRLSKGRPSRRAAIAAFNGVLVCALSASAFALPTGQQQLALIAVLMFFVAGANGPAAALVADLTPAGSHASAMAVLTLANNLLGIAVGPLAVGALADRIGLQGALQAAAGAALLAALTFAVAARLSSGDRIADRNRIEGQPA